MKARNLYLNTDSRSFVSGESGGVLSAPQFFQEDIEAINLYFLENVGTSQVGYLDYSANTVKFAVGTTTPAVLQLTWSAISTGVTVSITTLTNGGAGANEVQRISFSPKPNKGGFAVVLPSRNVAVSSVSANVFTAANHGLFDGQSVTITGFSFTGSSVTNGSSYVIINRTGDTFSLATTASSAASLTAAVTSGGGTVTLPEITTPALAFNARPQDLQQAFVDAGLSVSGAAQIVVSGSAGEEYTLSFNGGCQRINYAPVSIAANTLSAAPGLAANVNFSTTAISSLIDAGTNTVTMEIEVSDGTKRQTYQTGAVISNDIINSSAPITSIVNATTNFSLNSQDGSTWNITIDNSGILTASKV